jgi:hypothetical protein
MLHSPRKLKSLTLELFMDYGEKVVQNVISYIAVIGHHVSKIKICHHITLKQLEQIIEVLPKLELLELSYLQLQNSENTEKVEVKSSKIKTISIVYEFGIMETMENFVDEPFEIFCRLFRLPAGSLECFRFFIRLYTTECEFDEKSAKIFLENQPQLTEKKVGFTYEDWEHQYLYEMKVKSADEA